ncbi:MAG: thioredoxin domain-containing protein [Hyphomonadaceae bacterium]
MIQLTARFPRNLLIALVSVAFAACSGGDAGSNQAGGSVEGLVEMAKGDANAPHTLIEYASTTCGACGAFHSVMSDTIDQLVDEGKLRFIYRDYPRDSIDTAAFVLARCGGTEAYFNILDDIYEHQQGLFGAARNGTVKGVLETIGERHGISKDNFAACLEDEAIRSQIEASHQTGLNNNVTGTPTLFLDGVVIEAPEGRTPESLILLVDPTAATE